MPSPISHISFASWYWVERLTAVRQRCNIQYIICMRNCTLTVVTRWSRDYKRSKKLCDEDCTNNLHLWHTASHIVKSFHSTHNGIRGQILLSLHTGQCTDGTELGDGARQSTSKAEYLIPKSVTDTNSVYMCVSYQIPCNVSASSIFASFFASYQHDNLGFVFQFNAFICTELRIDKSLRFRGL